MEDIKLFDKTSTDNFLSKQLGISTRAIATLKKENFERYERETIGALAITLGFDLEYFMEFFLDNYLCSDIKKDLEIAKATKKIHSLMGVEKEDEYKYRFELIHITNLLNDCFYGCISEAPGFVETLYFLPDFENKKIEALKINKLNRYIMSGQYSKMKFNLYSLNGQIRKKSDIYNDVKSSFENYKNIPPAVHKNSIIFNPGTEDKSSVIEGFMFTISLKGSILQMFYDYECQLFKIVIEETNKKNTAITISSDLDDAAFFENLHSLSHINENHYIIELSNIFNAFLKNDSLMIDKMKKSYVELEHLENIPDKKIQLVENYKELLLREISEILCPGSHAGCKQLMKKYSSISGANGDRFLNSIYYKECSIDGTIEETTKSRDEFYEDYILEKNFIL